MSHLDRLSISGMLESENDFSEQFMRELLLPLYVLSKKGLISVMAPDFHEYKPWLGNPTWISPLLLNQ